MRFKQWAIITELLVAESWDIQVIALRCCYFDPNTMDIESPRIDKVLDARAISPGIDQGPVWKVERILEETTVRGSLLAPLLAT